MNIQNVLFRRRSKGKKIAEGINFIRIIGAKRLIHETKPLSWESEENIVPWKRRLKFIPGTGSFWLFFPLYILTMLLQVPSYQPKNNCNSHARRYFLLNSRFLEIKSHALRNENRERQESYKGQRRLSLVERHAQNEIIELSRELVFFDKRQGYLIMCSAKSALKCNKDFHPK